jgi:uncharacterized membrane protein YfcA
LYSDAHLLGKYRMAIVGYFLAVLIGLSLGLIGAGGSVLTIPVLVYVFCLDPVHATFYSLFIVGATSLFGASDYFKKGLVDIRLGLVFALPSTISVFLARKYILPAIPDHLAYLGRFELTKAGCIMLLFALLMLFTSLTMIRQKKLLAGPGKRQEGNTIIYPNIFLEGIVVGMLTGMLGAGGGFLIIPALVWFGGIPIKPAVGTSLMVVALNSLIGFSTEMMDHTAIDWTLLLCFTCFAFSGILMSGYTSRFIEPERLKSAFGWFILITGIFVIIKELL